jgi:flagellar assembly protein FliH
LARAFEHAPFTWGRDDAPAVVPTAAEPAAPDPEALAAEQQRIAEIERQAFTTGYSQGEKAGLDAGATRSEAMLRRVSETLDSLAALRTDMIKQTEQQMLQLALAIAKRILRREVALDPDLTVAMARVALERLGGAPSAKIRLHPEDYAVIVERSERSLESARVSVIADADLSRGSCLIESEFGYIEAGVETQFEEIAKALIDESETGSGRREKETKLTLVEDAKPPTALAS